MQSQGRQFLLQLVLLAAVCLAPSDARKTAKVSTGELGPTHVNAMSLLGMGGSSGGMHGMNIELIESSLLAMAKDGATPELQPFVDDIMNLTLDMMVEVEKQANVSQKTLDDAWYAFKACQQTYADAFWDLARENKSHIDCSVKEAQKAVNYNECVTTCGSLKTYRDIMCPQFAGVNVYPAIDNCKLQDNYLEKNTRPHMASLRDYYLGKLQDWQCKKKKCDDANDYYYTCLKGCLPLYNAWYVQYCICTEKQHALESRRCAPDSEDCTEYKQCYQDRRAAWELANTTVAEEEVSFLAEYRGLYRIKCLLEAFTASIDGTKDLSIGLEDCRVKSYNNATYLGHLYIEYYDIADNPFINCSYPKEGTAKPGSDAWIEYFYAGKMPTGTTYEDCGAECCVSCNSTCPETPDYYPVDVRPTIQPIVDNPYECYGDVVSVGR
eukprot:gb/GFBE01009930.1/.p1 GENE.gb/GFBE01009930.1/~~gb/GFBE01009930.1/.p1  ORF type:complete len:438 (+),score=81.40 gb/GFBE01009930.1/:1-1314(+)